MAANTGTTLPGGYRNSLGGPADEWYAQTNGTAYASLAEACVTVPQAFRRNRTVIVVDQEYWWLESDLSDNGLVLKTAASSGGTPGTGTGGSLLTYNFSFPVETDGAQAYPLPAGTAGLLFVTAQTEYGVLRPLSPSHYRLSGGNLVIDADASLQAGELVEGKRYTGGGSGGTSPGGPARDNNDVADTVQQAVTNASHTWSYGDLITYGTAALETAAENGVQKGDFFDSFEAGSQVDAYRYCYCLQNNGALGWTRIYKLQ